MTVWPSRKLVLAMHDEQLSEHGGAGGIRDEGLLESALARPVKLAGDRTPSLAELAAFHAIGMTRNHPFVGGNKRTAFAALVTVLDLNGAGFDPPDAEAVIAMLALASGESTDDEFTSWVARHVRSND